MTILQNFKIKKYPYFFLIFPVCLIAAGLVSTLPSTAAGSAEIMLAWDANTEADLAGYGIYFRNGVSGATYEFLAEVYVDELEDPDNPMVIITDLYNGLLTDRILPVVNMAELANNSTYHFALTAFDTQGETSNFSEELCLEVIGSSVVNCRSADSGGGSDASAEISADSHSRSADSDGPAEIGVDNSSGGGCFIATSAFAFPNELKFWNSIIIKWTEYLNFRHFRHFSQFRVAPAPSRGHPHTPSSAGSR